MNITDFIANFPKYFNTNQYPWKLTSNLNEILEAIIPKLQGDFNINNGVAIHKSVTIESNVTVNRPFIAMENCHIGANTYFREGVFLDQSVKIGPSTEIKSSIICSNTAIAHLNYIGNSIIGQHVNFEAGSVAANHYNEKIDKKIIVKFNNLRIETGVIKFGALVGDKSKIGANAVLSPGTILEKNSIVKRLQLIE
ncbi:DapH/DapD/GlmU-related protein [Aureibaculum sp. 2210JD6-5]|uniref:DapH/DapD/GlmU-related protein n=1 Tax=Aureibaculum sp. 2210JD6-5 TaxID=3103957 RepID=UPI002AAD2D91|nr:DapH/DapD/GlmU-related protein [Aureibaculum sp. 2210JD6-5]MDY7395558.1 DapH/DapD/GlmU-related protein [Aureibaculum sp. 2210JD6-5]